MRNTTQSGIYLTQLTSDYLPSVAEYTYNKDFQTRDQVEMLRIKISNICIIVIVVQFSYSNGVVVPTKYGNVRGLQTDDGYAFLGIPYAAPPVGNARYNRLYKL